MKILFIHQNFPGQFKYLAPVLAHAAGNEVTALTPRQDVPDGWGRVRIVRYDFKPSGSRQVHPWVLDIQSKVVRAEACFRAALRLRQGGYSPDVIVAHPGWGESLFLKQVWPSARLGIYAEFFYLAEGADAGFDPEFPVADPGDAARLRMKNIGNLLSFEDADAALSPTSWQASTYPAALRERIEVIHDGIDTDSVQPKADVALALDGQVFTRSDEIITFINRNLEPTRGYHVFMRMLPELLARRPQARVLVIGGDGTSYGAPPSGGSSWKQVFFDEVRDSIDVSRVLFLGKVSYEQFVAVMQLSTVHVYLTYPFVLSWSLLEAMSAGCAIVASDTQPVREVLVHGQTGRLVDFFDIPAWVREVCALLDDPAQRQRLGAQARAHVRAHYDLRRVCLPRQLEWVNRLAARAQAASPEARSP